MTNRAPLIINTSTSKITELPYGDSLDLGAGNLTNVTDISNVNNMTNIGNISVTGTTELGSLSNVKITGGTLGQTITTDGTGNLSWGQGGGGGASAEQIFLLMGA